MQHKFVENIPEYLEANIMYISLSHGTILHLCACGCGNEVVTPLSPVDWKMTYNGKHISLHPSIGNWNFDCKSHYWIINSEIRYSGRWSDEEVVEGRKLDESRKKNYYQEGKNEKNSRKKKKITDFISLFKPLYIRH